MSLLSNNKKKKKKIGRHKLDSDRLTKKILEN